ncbi:Uma2 family endonuclease [soil metagenome]|nr:Uma2 family endonuclease [Gemmatimonadota bacterium]
MSSHAQSAATLSPDEYLEFERGSEIRHEYVDGRIIEMAGTTHRHSAIVVNLIPALHPQLRGSSCRVLSTTMRVIVSRKRDYVYPDVLVVWNPVDLEDEHHDSLRNPALIVEVLSPSTQDYDHGRKWLLYQRISSLRDYLLVSQDRVQVERYERQADGSWLYRVLDDPEAELRLDSIGCTLALNDIYENVLEADAERSTSTDIEHG